MQFVFISFRHVGYNLNPIHNSKTSKQAVLKGKASPWCLVLGSAVDGEEAPKHNNLTEETGLQKASLFWLDFQWVYGFGITAEVHISEKSVRSEDQKRFLPAPNNLSRRYEDEEKTPSTSSYEIF